MRLVHRTGLLTDQAHGDSDGDWRSPEGRIGITVHSRGPIFALDAASTYYRRDLSERRIH